MKEDTFVLKVSVFIPCPPIKRISNFTHALSAQTMQIIHHCLCPVIPYSRLHEKLSGSIRIRQRVKPTSRTSPYESARSAILEFYLSRPGSEICISYPTEALLPSALARMDPGLFTIYNDFHSFIT
jgi:hypothetical protein